MIRLALMRHGVTSWNKAGRIQGHTDIELSDEGRAILAPLRLPAPWDAAQLWSSPLSRAVETAQIVAGTSPKTDPALMEMNWGDWEGKIGKQLKADPSLDYRDLQDWGWNYTPPNGESPAMLRDRLVPWANALTTHAVAVCHINIMRVLMAHAVGWNFAGSAPFLIKRNRLFVIEIADGKWRADTDTIRLVDTSK